MLARHKFFEFGTVAPPTADVGAGGSVVASVITLHPVNSVAANSAPLLVSRCAFHGDVSVDQRVAVVACHSFFEELLWFVAIWAGVTFLAQRVFARAPLGLAWLDDFEGLRRFDESCCGWRAPF